jgi:hypothetical protein
MAQKNRANMLTDIVSNIYNNLINFITGQNAQDRFVNLLDSSPNILSDASQPNGYVSTDANNEMLSSYYDEEISRADLITDLTANLAVGGKFYRINDAVGSTITLLVIAESNINLYQFAIDATTGEIGTYDITTDVFLTVSGTPDLQQVTDVGFITTNKILSDDGLGNYTEISNGEIKIGTGNTGEVIIDSSLVTAAYNAQLPDKPTSPQTFAMMSDITGGGLDLEVNGTPNVDQTLLNLIEGVNIDIADNGTGGVTITSLADRYSTSSVTSILIGNGPRTFTVDANLAYIPLQEVLIVYDPSNHMHATVTSYSGTTLVVDVKTHTGGGTFASWVINLDGVPVDAITGVGTANEIAYFTSGQVIASLPVATYPSLTELSYVKGVTSDIQTQLNNKVTVFASAADGTVSSGTTNTISISVLIAANTFAVDDVIRINHRIRATGTAAIRETRIYANTTNVIAGAILVSTASLGATILASNLQRFLAIKNATTNTEVVTATTSLLSDYNNLTTAVTTLAINWTVDQYIIFAVVATNAADTIRATMYSIEKL